ncbi:hypothetical protein Q1695_013773 [Nippostrongylus brasiliensis]|nr:hypothetical protein Q1695_013773 [Nippostrongylus brasiliensis]
METVVELEQKRVCRVMSEKKGRFTVENLNHVRCALVSDCENLGLLEKATTSAHYDEITKTVSARLTMNMRETQKKKSEANYLMDVIEAHIDHCEYIKFDNSLISPHVAVFAVSTDDKSKSLDHIETVKTKIETLDWSCPVILLAYRTPNTGPVSYEVMKQLKELSKNSRVFRCMESKGLGRNLLRHCFAVALMAARPFLATTRAEDDLCICDGTEKRWDKSRKANLEEKCPNIEALQHKPECKKSCRIQ